jgi:hypothetical protein
MTDFHASLDAALQRQHDGFAPNLHAPTPEYAEAACTCNPNHLEAGAYDPGCVVHDPTHQEPPC